MLDVGARRGTPVVERFVEEYVARARLLVVCIAVLALVGCRHDGGDDGFRLENVSRGWTSLPPPPETRGQSATVWTGEKLLTWGGEVLAGGGEASEGDGYVFDAAALEWTTMSDAPLAARVRPASAWTGEELLVWGGTDARHEVLYGDGAAYDPGEDAWRVLPDAPISGRAALSVWTGDELLVWGTSIRVDPRPRDGAAYDPDKNAWRGIATAPIELTDATAIWSGTEMIVLGAALHGGNVAESPTAIGAAYDPSTDTWRALPDPSLSPQASTAVWNGRELIAWDYGNKTAAYDPRTGEWRDLPDVPLDAGECSPESVPVAEDVFGDYCGRLALFDSTTDDWRDISRPELARSALEIIPAGGVVLVLAASTATGDTMLMAYRPS